MIDIDKALSNPASVFAEPTEIVANKELNQQQKIAILQQWEYDIRGMAVAEEENMPGDTDHGQMLTKLHAALRELGVDPEEEGSTGAKHGGHN